MCNTVITLSKVIFHSFLYVYQRVIYEDCTNLPIGFAVGIGIHWKPLETSGNHWKLLDPPFCWSVQSMFHGGCPIAGWFHTDNPEMADFRGPFHETSISHRKIGSTNYLYQVHPIWTKYLRKMAVFQLHHLHSSALSGLLRHATNACCSR